MGNCVSHKKVAIPQNGSGQLSRQTPARQSNNLTGQVPLPQLKTTQKASDLAGQPFRQAPTRNGSDLDFIGQAPQHKTTQRASDQASQPSNQSLVYKSGDSNFDFFDQAASYQASGNADNSFEQRHARQTCYFITSQEPLHKTPSERALVDQALLLITKATVRTDELLDELREMVRTNDKQKTEDVCGKIREQVGLMSKVELDVEKARYRDEQCQIYLRKMERMTGEPNDMSQSALLVRKSRTSYLIAYASGNLILNRLGAIDSLGWPAKELVAEVACPEKEDFEQICSVHEGDMLVTRSKSSENVILLSIWQDEIKGDQKLRLGDAGRRIFVQYIDCFKKSDYFAFSLSDGTIGIIYIRTGEIVSTTMGEKCDLCTKVQLNCDDTLLATQSYKGKLLVYSVRQDSSTGAVTLSHLFEYQYTKREMLNAQFSPHDPNVLVARKEKGLSCWDLQVLREEQKPKDSSQIESSPPNPLRWTAELDDEYGDISFFPKVSNRLQVTFREEFAIKSTHIFTVDDGRERTDEKMEGVEYGQQWSKDGEASLYYENGLVWKHLKSKLETRLSHGQADFCFVSQQNQTQAKIESTIQRAVRSKIFSKKEPKQPLSWNSGDVLAMQASDEESKTIEEYLSKFLNQRLAKLDPQQPITGKALATDFNQVRGEVAKLVTGSGKQFRPTKVIAISVVHRNFSELRRLYQFRNVADLHSLLYDRKKLLQGLRCLLNVGQVELRNYDDLSFPEFSQIFTDLAMELKASKKAGIKTLVVFLYGGHGIQDNFTYALCNSLILAKIWFPLEKRLRMLAENVHIADSIYILGILDCCREKMSIKDVQEKVKGSEAGRGGENAEEAKEGNAGSNTVLIFSCPPNSYTPVDSPTVVELFQVTVSVTDKFDNICQLPILMLGYKPGNKGEIVCWVSREVAFKFNVDAQPAILSQNGADRIEAEVESRAISVVTAMLQHFAELCIKPDLEYDNRRMLSVNKVNGKTEWLNPHNVPDNPKIEKGTCTVGQKVYEVQKDGIFQMDVPDFQNKKYQTESLQKTPVKGDWHKTCLAYSPKDYWSLHTLKVNYLKEAKGYAQKQEKMAAKQKETEVKKEAVTSSFLNFNFFKKAVTTQNPQAVVNSAVTDTQRKQDKEKYDKQQALLKSFFRKISEYGRVRKESRIFAFGPAHGVLQLPRPLIYFVDKDVWTDLRPDLKTRMPVMSQERLGGKSCVHDDYIYAIGGKTRNGERINTIERLNIHSLNKWEMLNCVFEVPEDYGERDYFEVCPFNDSEILLVTSKLYAFQEMTILDTKTQTVRKTPSSPFQKGLAGMTQLKPNEVLYATEEGLVNYSRLGSNSKFSDSNKDYPEKKELVTKKTKFDYNLAIRNHDPQLYNLFAEEELAIHHWQELYYLEYCHKFLCEDESLKDLPNVDWYPLKVAKVHFVQQHLCREEFAYCLNQLWKECNKKMGIYCKGPQPENLLNAKIDALVKLYPERHNQFTLEDLELLRRLQDAFEKEGIRVYFRNIYEAKREEEEQL